jgi:hypothetical protein
MLKYHLDYDLRGTTSSRNFLRAVRAFNSAGRARKSKLIDALHPVAASG